MVVDRRGRWVPVPELLLEGGLGPSGMGCVGSEGMSQPMGRQPPPDPRLPAGPEELLVDHVWLDRLPWSVRVREKISMV
ncbi:MAG TPA: hypothetical protein VIV15_12260, partial [Anaerolineales bacterium]